MSGLAACHGCRRHIRMIERACPFCGVEALPHAASSTTEPTAWPRTRAAILFAGATAIAGCGKTTDNMPAPAYGAPPPDHLLAADAVAPVPDAGMMTAPAYGVPPPRPELSPPSSATPDNAGSVAPKAPPPKKK